MRCCLTSVSRYVCEQRKLVSERLATKAKLAEVEKACGLSTSPLGILADLDLRRHVDFMQALRYDWMHCALQDGTMSVESSLLFSAACSVGGVTPDELERHFKEDWFFVALSSWSWKSAVAHVSAVGEACATKAQASQMIMLHSLLKHLFTLRIGHIAALEPQLKSYCAACDCVDIMLLAKRQLLPMAQAATKLQRALRHHMLCHVAAYGNEHIKPKFHYMFDVADQLARDEFVVDCFIVERLHLRAKRAATSILNTTAYERSVITGVMISHMNALANEGSEEFGLVGRAGNVPGVRKAVVARGCVSRGVRMCAGDLVFRDKKLGKVSSCVMEDGALFVLVHEMREVERLSASSSVWASAPVHHEEVWRAHEVCPAVAWMTSSANTIVLRM